MPGTTLVPEKDISIDMIIPELVRAQKGHHDIPVVPGRIFGDRLLSWERTRLLCTSQGLPQARCDRAFILGRTCTTSGERAGRSR